MDSLIESAVRRVIREEIASVLGEQPFRLALTIPEAAAAVGYSVETMRKEIRNHYLVPSYANSKPVVPVEELQRWLRALPDEPR